MINAFQQITHCPSCVCTSKSILVQNKEFIPNRQIKLKGKWPQILVWTGRSVGEVRTSAGFLHPTHQSSTCFKCVFSPLTSLGQHGAWTWNMVTRKAGGSIPAPLRTLGNVSWAKTLHHQLKLLARHRFLGPVNAEWWSIYASGAIMAAMQLLLAQPAWQKSRHVTSWRQLCIMKQEKWQRRPQSVE